MPVIVMGRGPSVNIYHRNELTKLCKNNFTIACNDAGLDFPCDVICATDPDWIKGHVDELKRARKPIITRKWDHLIHLGLDLIELPNDITNAARLTGAVAAKIGDTLAQIQNTICYAFGLDHNSIGHYDLTKNTGQPLQEMMSQYAYYALNCRNIVNMSPGSEIKCWKKSDKLPLSFSSRSRENRLYDIQFLRRFIKEIFYCEVKK